MKQACYGLLALLFVAGLAAPALAYDMKGNVHHQGPQGPRMFYQCDDGNLDNGYYENQYVAYGNAFDVSASPGPLSWISFVHFGWFTLHGPYNYNIRVYDDLTCTQMCLIGPLEAADAYDHDEIEMEDLCTYQCMLTGPSAITVEPLSCYSSTDCYPDLYFDQTGPMDGCDRIIDINAPDCTPVLNGDFVLQVTVDECTPVPAEQVNWGTLKAIYR